MEIFYNVSSIVGLKLWGMLATPSFTGDYPQIKPFGLGTLGYACYPQFHWGLSTDQALRAWYLEQLIEVTP